LADPTVMVEESPELAVVLVGSPPHALSGSSTATTAATAASLVLVGKVSIGWNLSFGR
jgi:hypothetical protein